MEANLQGPFGRIVLGHWVLTIGRSMDNRLLVHSPIASSHHAEICPVGSSYSLIDLGSTNGTFVNEQQLAPYSSHLLQDGDRIRIGDMVCLYQASHPDVQMPFAQKSNHIDVPTAKVNAIDVRAMGQSERFGDQPSASYAFSPLQQPAPPIFTPPSGTSHTPQLAAERVTGYGMTGQQSVSPPFPSTFGQSNIRPWATDGASSNGLPPQPLPYAPPPVHAETAQLKSSNVLKGLLIALSMVLVLGAAGGGITAYMLTRPQPVINVTSAYQVGSTPAGSTGTVLHVSARSFSGSSVITFLLDALPVASNQHVSSDANGNVKADFMITSDWTVGRHTLTAKDASNYATKIGVPVVIVAQGQAHTPGPNGAPPDDKSFILYVHVQEQDAGTGKQLESYTETLTVTGKPDPSGGTVCQYRDDGQPQTSLGNDGNGLTYRDTASFSCSGSYKAGKLTYTETTTSERAVFSDGVTCVSHTPYVLEHLEGMFTSPNTISGTLSSDSIIGTCNQGIGTLQMNAKKGSWTAQLE